MKLSDDTKAMIIFAIILLPTVIVPFIVGILY